MATGKELVNKTLEFRNPERVPRDHWTLPWASARYPDEIKKMREEYFTDMKTCPGFQKVMPKTSGEQYGVGEYTDDWGCSFINVQQGVIGEVKNPIVAKDDENWDDISKIHIPRELLDIDKEKINQFCKENSDKFILSSALPRPFERLQFLRGTENLYIDLMLKPQKMLDFIQEMHAFYCELLEAWCDTDVDAVFFMDDWGAQSSLLINPTIWVEMFKPLYKDYIDIAHKHGKKAFMHSDGHILAIIPHLIDLGLDALNSQLFCMGVENLAQFKGKITFWGEIDRQHILVTGSQQDVKDAVNLVKDTLWDNGGCIAQCEFGPGAKPENVNQVYEAWNNIKL
ncbi:MAG: methyltransferase [Clostridiales bacterium]|nr:methyltransferase [Clostridiales bacterium]